MSRKSIATAVAGTLAPSGTRGGAERGGDPGRGSTRNGTGRGRLDPSRADDHDQRFHLSGPAGGKAREKYVEV